MVFTTILNQIESYDKLVQVMVDALWFVTPLSLDVIGFCILSRLSGTTGINRSPLKEDGVNVSQWLQSLESFIGAFYKRFPLVEFQGILCYLLSRLAGGHVMELGVLRTLLKTAGGWAFADYAPAASLSMTQVEGRAGSTLLKRETMSFGVVDKNTNLIAAQAIRRVLQQDDLGVSLLILLAQVRHQIVFGSTSGRPKPVKLIGNLFDTCQVTTVILLDFLTNPNEGRTEAIEKYAKSMPSLSDLRHEYKMDVASAWMLCRPLFRAANSMDEEMEDGDVNPLEAFKSTTTRESYESMLPETTWAHMSPDLFEVFYANAVYDLFCPEDVYAAEISRLDKETDRLAKSLNAPQLAQPGLAASPANEEKAELERVKDVAEQLTIDFTAHKKHVESIHATILERSDSFFPSDQVSRESMATFLTRCIYPRCMQGPDDAMYCAHFILRLHEMATPGFSTMHFLDCMIVALSRSLFGLTESEAANVAILLFEIWKVLSRWRYDADCFANEVAAKPGALMATTSDSDGDNLSTTVHSISAKDFEQLYNKWHASIGASSLGCLESSEYMHKRCCLIVLTRMVDVFPTRPRLGNKLLQALEPLQDESNTLADIRASAQAYSTQLLKARDEGVWKEEDAATVQARQEKEQAAAAARQKKAEEQMEEMKRESQKITEEIGEWDGRRDRDRDRRRADGPPPMESRRPASRAFDAQSNRMMLDDSRRHDDRRDDRRRPPPPPPPPRADDRWARDRGPSAPASGNYSAMASSVASRGRETSSGGGGTARRGDEGPEHRGLEGRWQRAGEARSERASGSKRSRPSSPTEPEGGDRSSKRSRTAGGLEPGEEEPSRGEEGVGGRRRGRGRRR